jgi:quercetin dioxygenase-like cupin family protein
MTTTDTITTPYLTHQGESRWFGDCLFEFLVPSDETGGQISVFRATCPEGFGPPRHVHTAEDEVFLVLEGDVRFEIDGVPLAAGPGTTVWMPRGVPHAFRVESAVAVMVGIITPGGFEHLFRTLSVPAEDRALPPAGRVPLAVADIVAEQERRGTRVVGPPMAA